MTDDDPLFEHGTAALLNTRGRFAVVKCCHCHGQHAHERTTIGTRAALAGCSAPGRPRTYAIPERRKANR